MKRFITICLLTAGCATTSATNGSTNADMEKRLAKLEAESKAKDARIADLERDNNKLAATVIPKTPKSKPAEEETEAPTTVPATATPNPTPPTNQPKDIMTANYVVPRPQVAIEPPCDVDGPTAYGPVNETKLYLDGWTPYRGLSTGGIEQTVHVDEMEFAVSVALNGRQMHVFRGQTPTEVLVRRGSGYCRMPVIPTGTHTGYFIPDEIEGGQQLEFTCWSYVSGRAARKGHTWVETFRPTGSFGFKPQTNIANFHCQR